MRGIAAVLAAIAAVFGIAAAEAHGPTRQKVTETIEIDAPADRVWAVVGNFQDMSWLPVVTATAGTGGNEVGATRVLTLDGGATVDEVLEKYDPAKMLLAYRITRVDVAVLPVDNYSSRITVEALGDKSVVTWTGAFYRGYLLNDPPPELNDEAAKTAVTNLYRSGLAGLKAKVESGS
jgi:hypothetical protein